eukprot:COSAG02_NODE_6939_length_3275_cov_3.165302_1_plen_804_part_00
MAMQLTVEQQAVLGTVQPPGVHPTPPIVRVSAGAGTGKTTTMEQLCRHLAAKGHRHGSYLVFGKAAQLDAEKRIRRAEGTADLPSGLQVTTVDACALACVLLSRAAGAATTANSMDPMDDSALRKVVRSVCGDAISEFLKEVTGSPTVIRRCERQVANFIQKTLTGFLHSARDPDGVDGGFSPTAQYPGRAYYPAQLWHERSPQFQGVAAPNGVPRKWYQGRWYLEQARLLWDRMVTFDIVTFSSIMKLAQLGRLEIPGTFLLVDESQDLNECQIDLLLQQQVRGVHAFFVGDMAQSIFGFRGAKSEPLLNHDPALDLPLTESFRFGPCIACIANAILFIKKKSLQTSVADGGFSNKRRRLWKPYTIKGRSAYSGQVGWAEQSSLLDCGHQVTILARGNATLLSACLPRVLASVAAGRTLKVSVNGKGESSGLSKWTTIIKQVREFTKLWVASGPEVPVEAWRGTTLDFEEFAGESELTWKGALEMIEGQDLQHFTAAIALVCEHGRKSTERLAAFEEHVLKQKYTQDEADIVLSTIHSAKGMEWDNVEICNDLVPLAKFRVVNRNPSSPCIQSASVPLDMAAMFDFPGYGDDINLWYVAVTRARKRLSLPRRFKEMIDVFRQIQYFASNKGSLDDSPVRGVGPLLSQAEDLPDSPSTCACASDDDSTITVAIEGKRRDTIESFTLSRREAQLIAHELDLSPVLRLMSGRRGRWDANAGCTWVWDAVESPHAAPASPKRERGHTAALVTAAVARDDHDMRLASTASDVDSDCVVTSVVTRSEREKRARDNAEDLSVSPAKQQR